MGNYMLLYRGVCLEDPPGFYVDPARNLVYTDVLELDGVRISFHILFVNRLVVFRFIELYSFIKLYFLDIFSNVVM
jgi:hypothetical protein